MGVEYRVRPVVRYVVTRYESGNSPDGGTYGQCETVGEYPNEDLAERMKAALEASDPKVPATNGYIIVKRGFEVATQAYYESTLDDAAKLKAELEAIDGEWHIAKRV